MEYILANTPHLKSNNEFEFNNLHNRQDTLNQIKNRGKTSKITNSEQPIKSFLQLEVGLQKQKTD